MNKVSAKRQIDIKLFDLLPTPSFMWDYIFVYGEHIWIGLYRTYRFMINRWEREDLNFEFFKKPNSNIILGIISPKNLRC